MAGRVGDVPRVEHAMDAVMALTTVATRLGDRAGLVAFDQQVRAVVPPGHGRRSARRVTEAMYDLEPALAESDYRGAFAETLARFRRRAMLVRVHRAGRAGVGGDAAARRCPLVARDHLVVVGAVHDPDVERWARATPTTPAAAYRKAAAVRGLGERRRRRGPAAGAGRHRGRRAPGRLAPALADAYLDGQGDRTAVGSLRRRVGFAECARPPRRAAARPSTTA